MAFSLSGWARAETIKIDGRSHVKETGIRLEAMPKLKGFVVEAGREGSEEANRVRVGGQAFDSRVLWRGALTEPYQYLAQKLQSH